MGATPSGGAGSGNYFLQVSPAPTISFQIDGRRYTDKLPVRHAILAARCGPKQGPNLLEPLGGRTPFPHLYDPAKMRRAASIDRGDGPFMLLPILP